MSKIKTPNSSKLKTSAPKASASPVSTQKLFAEVRKSFPDPRKPMNEGVLAFGDDLSVERLLEAYSFGIFPWPHEDLPVLWFSPDQRGVLDFEDLHIPRSLDKFLSKCEWRCTFNQAFNLVIEACALIPRPGQAGTWITSQLLDAYKDFHRAGYAHSVEVWSRERSAADGSTVSENVNSDGETLVGGLYGTYVAGVFSGESMFYLRDNASKVALLAIIDRLRAQGIRWMDTQMVTPVLETLGGKYISRDEFLSRLDSSKLTARPLVL